MVGLSFVTSLKFVDSSLSATFPFRFMFEVVIKFSPFKAGFISPWETVHKQTHINRGGLSF